MPVGTQCSTQIEPVEVSAGGDTLRPLAWTVSAISPNRRSAPAMFEPPRSRSMSTPCSHGRASRTPARSARSVARAPASFWSAVKTGRDAVVRVPARSSTVVGIDPRRRHSARLRAWSAWSRAAGISWRALGRDVGGLGCGGTPCTPGVLDGTAASRSTSIGRSLSGLLQSSVDVEYRQALTTVCIEFDTRQLHMCRFGGGFSCHMPVVCAYGLHTPRCAAATHDRKVCAVSDLSDYLKRHQGDRKPDQIVEEAARGRQHRSHGGLCGASRQARQGAARGDAGRAGCWLRARRA